MGKQTLNQMTERHRVGTFNGSHVQRTAWLSRSKYKPHQGKRECIRRVCQSIEICDTCFLATSKLQDDKHVCGFNPHPCAQTEMMNAPIVMRDYIPGR